MTNHFYLVLTKGLPNIFVHKRTECMFIIIFRIMQDTCIYRTCAESFPEITGI